MVMEASNQSQLPGLEEKGELLMSEARQWVEDHPDCWAFYMAQAKTMSARGYASTNFLTNMMRYRFMVRIMNAYAPCFSRIALEQDPALRFKTNKSMADGFTEAVL